MGFIPIFRGGFPVLPKKLEWDGFVLNSKLIWKETNDKPEWVRDLDMLAGKIEELESPLSLLKDASFVEPLGSWDARIILEFEDIEIGSYMVMATKIPASLNYPKITTLPFSKCFRSRFLVVASLHESTFAFNRRLYPQLCFFHVARPSSVNSSKRIFWSIRSSLDGSGSDPPPGSSTNGGTRLIRAIQAFQIKLNARFQEMKKGFPLKVLFFLVGFYCATAFATVIGQTGDWDILSAGLAVVVVEGIGALMYRASFPLPGKIRSLITIFNYWKAGLSLGLFLDAFKYEIDNIFGLPNPFDFEMNVFPIFL
ncbi:hypothetical protein HHK36_028718 [Tetracentron sinense]|uniref:Ycf20-like protein n=1 Tax=Tetracentron sinense TaxID=13715 RepID=A0A835D0V2_TETSI|nr:hypothetical protein HHK36_028718 [Tetracentron sinense]